MRLNCRIIIAACIVPSRLCDPKSVMAIKTSKSLDYRAFRPYDPSAFDWEQGVYQKSLP